MIDVLEKILEKKKESRETNSFYWLLDSENKRNNFSL